jgi:hypothetical protein
VVFNIAMGNHGDAVSTASLDPLVEYMRGALSICGYEVTVGWDTIRPDAVNLLFEYFVDRNLVDNIVSLRRRSSVKFGIVATDLIVGSSIPDAKYSMPLDGHMVPNRIQGFETLAREVHFVWSWLQRTADAARRHNPVSECFPVGHVAEVPARLRRSPRDIEVLFLGMRTPHRDRVLDALRSHGLKVVCVGQGFPSEHHSRRILESLIDRSKIGLNLNLLSERELSDIDPRFASGMRIVSFLERETCVVSEETPLDNPYKGYMHSAEPEAIAETCRALLSGDRWRSAGRDFTKRFREEMDASKICGPVVARTLTTMN